MLYIHKNQIPYPEISQSMVTEYFTIYQDCDDETEEQRCEICKRILNLISENCDDKMKIRRYLHRNLPQFPPVMITWRSERAFVVSLASSAAECVARIAQFPILRLNRTIKMKRC